MSAIAIVPVKRLGESKSRLRSVLPPEERRALTLWLLGRVLGALRAARALDATYVVTPDPEVAAHARRCGAQPLPEHGTGLNGALAAATREVLPTGGAAAGFSPLSDSFTARLIVLGDLPFLQAGDVREMLRILGDERGAVAAPDRARRGTNALLLRPPEALDLRFGPDSYPGYAAAARRAGVPLRTYHSPGTGFDVDDPADLEELREWDLLDAPRHLAQAAGWEPGGILALNTCTGS